MGKWFSDRPPDLVGPQVITFRDDGAIELRWPYKHGWRAETVYQPEEKL